MNGRELADAVKARLEALIPSRPVYVGTPSADAPARYLIVHASEGSEESTRSTFTTNVQTPTLWVTSVAHNTDQATAEREAGWTAPKIRAALRNWRPESAWSVRPEISRPARRDGSMPEHTFTAVEQFSLRSHI